MICILGDVHFNSSKDYYIHIGNAFIDWFANWIHNNSANVLILAGDLVNTSVNGGIVIDQLERLILASKFKSIYLVVGNHDVKKKDGVEQLAYKFLAQKPNIHIIERLSLQQIEGANVLLLPHYLPEANEPTMVDYYSNLHKTIHNDILLTVGHFSDEQYTFGTDGVRNLEKLKTKYICLGHIHTRVNPKRYIGSVYTTRLGEHDNTRAAWLLDTATKQMLYDPLPTFSEFLSAEYPNPLPETKAIVPIYTITNCASEQLARMQYGNIFIRKVLRGSDLKKVTSDHTEVSKNVQNMDIPAMFTEFLRTYPVPLDRSVASICSKLLSTN